MVAATGVITQQELVGENGRAQLGAVVFQTAMPYAMFQLEQRFQPVVERFDRLTTSGVKFSALAAFQELSALSAMPTLQASKLCGWLRQAFSVSFLRITGILRAQKTHARPFSLRAPFNAFAEVVVVITTVGKHVFHILVQLADLLAEGRVFTYARRIDGSQQGANRSIGGRRDNDLIGITLYPAMILRVSPSALDIYAVESLRDAALLAVLFVPFRSAGLKQTLIYRHAGRIGNAVLHEFFALQTNSRLVKAINPAVAIEIRAAAGKLLGRKSLGNFRPMLRKVAVLGVFSLFLFKDCDHNQYSDYPIRYRRFSSRPRPWRLAFGLFENRYSHFYQCSQARAVPGTPCHSSDLQLKALFLVSKRNITSGGPCA